MNIKQKADLILESESSNKEKIIRLCKLVQEIPYKRIGGFNPEDMVFVGKGSCTPKHLFLASYLKRMDIPLKFLIIPFYYKKQPWHYPKKEMSIVNNMPLAYHVALQAKIQNKWRIIDVTWDSKLKSLGVPVNEKWNGEDDMHLGVVPEEIIETNSDPREYRKDKSIKYSTSEAQAQKKFYKLLDTLMEQCRA